MAPLPLSPFRRIAVAVRLRDDALSERLALEIAGTTDLVWSEEAADVLIADSMWPTGHHNGPIVLIVDVDPAELSPAVRALLTTDASPSLIVSAARLVAEGLIVLPDRALERLAEITAEGIGEDDPSERPPGTLTPREQQVLELLGAGASNKAIARHLDVSVHTVKFHVASLLRKLGASGRLEAVGVGLRTGLLML